MIEISVPQIKRSWPSTKMELINSSGTRVSLLNDTPSTSMPSHALNHSRTFSYESQTPNDDSSHSLSSRQHTPPTPELTRLCSESSHSTVDTRSPVTPNQTYTMLENHILSPRAHALSYGNNLASLGRPDSSTTTHGPDYRQRYQSQTKINPLDAIQYKPQPPRLNIRTSRFPTSPELMSPGTDSAPPKKKNKFPCPEWRNGCTDLFTTSGHAARHGKKHSGEKNVVCPVCNKAFTRKDNMKQHQRTHESGRCSSLKGKPKGEPRLKRTRQKQQVEQRQRQRTSSTVSIQSSMPSTDQHIESHPASSSRTSYRYPTPPTRDAFQDLSLRSSRDSQSHDTTDNTQSRSEDVSAVRYQTSPSCSRPLSAGLDVLAIAASGVSYIERNAAWEQS